MLRCYGSIVGGSVYGNNTTPAIGHHQITQRIGHRHRAIAGGGDSVIVAPDNIYYTRAIIVKADIGIIGDINRDALAHRHIGIHEKRAIADGGNGASVCCIGNGDKAGTQILKRYIARKAAYRSGAIPGKGYRCARRNIYHIYRTGSIIVNCGRLRCCQACKVDGLRTIAGAVDRAAVLHAIDRDETSSIVDGIDIPVRIRDGDRMCTSIVDAVAIIQASDRELTVAIVGNKDVAVRIYHLGRAGGVAGHRQDFVGVESGDLDR